MRAGIIVEEATKIKEGKNLVPRTWQLWVSRVESRMRGAIA